MAEDSTGEASVPEEPAGGAWQRPRARLRRRRSFRVGAAVLALLSALAVYAPLVANDRPLYLVAIHRGEFERARRTLVPVAQALANLLARPTAEFETPAGAAARAAEDSALAGRLAIVGASLQPDRAAACVALEQELAAVRGLAEEGQRERARETGTLLVQHARELAEDLEHEQPSLVPRTSFPAFAALSPLEVGLAAAWPFVLLLPFLARRFGPRRALLLPLCVAPVVALGRGALGAGDAFPTAAFKDGITRGEIEARAVLFPLVPYGYAEQHAEEGLRPPTWLDDAEMDERGAYVRGARIVAPDRITGYVPATRPVEVRAGEPALNSSWRHVLGTDTTGRDLLARAIHGARVSLAVGFLATALLLVIGTGVGALAGYFGGALDLVLSRLIEVVVSFPLFFLVLVAVAFVGPSMWNVVLVLGLVGWTGVARLCRSEFQRQRELEYVAAARVLGFSWPRIVFRHVLPNAVAPLLVAATFSVASAILVEAALSFLGYGVRVPIASWGVLASESRDLSNWWLQLFPGLFLLVTVLCVQLVSDALRDAFDPRHGAAR